MIHEQESLLLQNDNPSTRSDWSWAQLKEYSPFRVDQFKFPKTNSGYTLPGPTPCTDGETLWIPQGSLDSQASFLFHEMAHAFLHYPNGKDPDLIDPLPRNESVWEMEACLTASQVIRGLGLADAYNAAYMRGWQGEYGDIRVDKVAAAGNNILALYLRRAKWATKHQRTKIEGGRMNRSILKKELTHFGGNPECGGGESVIDYVTCPKCMASPAYIEFWVRHASGAFGSLLAHPRIEKLGQELEVGPDGRLTRDLSSQLNRCREFLDMLGGKPVKHPDRGDNDM